MPTKIRKKREQRRLAKLSNVDGSQNQEILPNDTTLNEKELAEIPHENELARAKDEKKKYSQNEERKRKTRLREQNRMSARRCRERKKIQRSILVRHSKDEEQKRKTPIREQNRMSYRRKKDEDQKRKTRIREQNRMSYRRCQERKKNQRSNFVRTDHDEAQNVDNDDDRKRDEKPSYKSHMKQDDLEEDSENEDPIDEKISKKKRKNKKKDEKKKKKAVKNTDKHSNDDSNDIDLDIKDKSKTSKKELLKNMKKTLDEVDTNTSDDEVTNLENELEASSRLKKGNTSLLAEKKSEKKEKSTKPSSKISKERDSVLDKVDSVNSSLQNINKADEKIPKKKKKVTIDESFNQEYSDHELSEESASKISSGYGTESVDHFSSPPVGAVNINMPVTQLGKVAPRCLPGLETFHCMQCETKFTMTKRRHHCRACGKIFCNSCCNLKCKLDYLGKEARVCSRCYQDCVRGTNKSREPKQVMFSDGIRPGGDLTELDGPPVPKLPIKKSGRVAKKVEKATRQDSKWSLKAADCNQSPSLIPDHGLPTVVQSSIKNTVTVEETWDEDFITAQIKNLDDATPVSFILNKNLQVLVKLVTLDCCVNRTCWCFSTKGMCTVAQDEVVIILECLDHKESIPRDIFYHLQTVYEQASRGNTVSHLGHTIFGQSFLGSKEHCGFLYIHPSFQCLQKIPLPPAPYVFGILLQRWETPWAKIFPIRLLLRLGAEYRYYPCPLVSVRNRKPVFGEIGHTIMNLLADFRNFQYMLQQIKGLTIHMQDRQTLINLPKNRYDDIMKVIGSSNDHVMALGGNFSLSADSHLVCIQNDDGNYHTQAINIQNKPRKVTGASFVVFNGALKTSSGLHAKSSIVEDGLMVQITPENMVLLKAALHEMQNFTIECGSIEMTEPEEKVFIEWIDDDRYVNVGVVSPIDGMKLEGTESLRIHNATDYVGTNFTIRWIEVFFVLRDNEQNGSPRCEPVDLSRLAETLAEACCVALIPHLDNLKKNDQSKIGLRVSIHAEGVGYEIGAHGKKLDDCYMNELDNELIPVIHNATSRNLDEPIILELIFHIIN